MVEWEIVECWDRIKRLRATQTFSSTTTRLLIESTEADLKKDVEFIDMLVDFDVEIQRHLFNLRVIALNLSDQISTAWDQLPPPPAAIPNDPSLQNKRRRNNVVENESEPPVTTATSTRSGAVDELGRVKKFDEKTIRKSSRRVCTFEKANV